MADQIEYAFLHHPKKAEHLKTIILEHTRTTSDPPHPFVEPFAGAMAEIKVKRPGIVFGRRGSGKTSLLRQAQKELVEGKKFCAFIDADPLKSLSLADQLITTLRNLLRQLRRWMKNGRAALSAGLIESITKEESELEQLLAQNEQPTIEIRETQVLSDTERSGTSGTFVLPFFKARGDVASAQTRAGEISQVQLLTSAKLTQLYRRQANALSELFDDIKAEINDDMYVMVDDFYHINIKSQPYFMDFLHGLFKHRKVWLKIGSIETRTLVRWQVGNLIYGVELGQDAFETNLDKPFKEFHLTRRFLAGVVEGLCSKAGLSQEQLMTEGSFNRLIQASGGVARDLLNLLSATLAHAYARYERDKGVPRISADDTWSAAAQNDVTKKKQFRQDIDGADQSYYLLKLEDVKKFCFKNDDNRLLVDIDANDSDARDLRVLWDAKFVHIIDDKMKFNERHFVSYCLDIGTHAEDWNRRRIVVDLSDGDVGATLRRPGLIFNSGP